MHRCNPVEGRKLAIFQWLLWFLFEIMTNSQEMKNQIHQICLYLSALKFSDSCAIGFPSHHQQKYVHTERESEKD